MGRIADAITTIWRDFVTDGVPGSGPYNPKKPDIRTLGPVIESELAGAAAGLVRTSTLAALNAAPGARVGQPGEVTADGTNRGAYSWTGAAWVKVGDIINPTEVVGQRGTVANGSDIALLSKPGIYVLSANGGYLNGPPMWDATVLHCLVVYNYGGSGGGGNGRYPIQTIISYAVTSWGVHRRYERSLDTDNPGNTAGNFAWTETTGRNPTELFVQRGQLAAGTDLNTVRTPGTWLLLPGAYPNAPTGYDIAAAYMLTVFSPGGDFAGVGLPRFPLQRLVALNAASGSRSEWVRVFDYSNPTAPTGAWTSAAGGTPQAGKTIVAIGDSITEGNYAYQWPPIVAARLGATVVNGGFGGCRMANHTGHPQSAYYDEMGGHSLSARIKDGNWSVLTTAADDLYAAIADDNRPQAAALAALDWSTVDTLVVAFGTNDFAAAIPIGTESDMDATTFKGAINLVINNVLSTYPAMDIVFLTPIWRSRVNVNGDDSNETPNSAGVYLQAYRDAIIERAAAFQIPVIDLYSLAGFNITNWEPLLPDGLHPYSTEGMQRMGDRIAAGLSGLI